MEHVEEEMIHPEHVQKGAIFILLFEKDWVLHFLWQLYLIGVEGQ